MDRALCLVEVDSHSPLTSIRHGVCVRGRQYSLYRVLCVFSLRTLRASRAISSVGSGARESITGLSGV